MTIHGGAGLPPAIGDVFEKATPVAIVAEFDVDKLNGQATRSVIRQELAEGDVLGEVVEDLGAKVTMLSCSGGGIRGARINALIVRKKGSSTAELAVDCHADVSSLELRRFIGASLSLEAPEATGAYLDLDLTNIDPRELEQVVSTDSQGRFLFTPADPSRYRRLQAA
jgi:hypothetical protein